MAIFNSYVSLPEGINVGDIYLILYSQAVSLWIPLYKSLSYYHHSVINY